MKKMNDWNSNVSNVVYNTIGKEYYHTLSVTWDSSGVSTVISITVGRTVHRK